METGSKLSAIKGIGPETEKKFARLGIRTPRDLAYNYPRRYDDYSTLLPIETLMPGDVTIKASLHEVKGRYVRRGMHVTEAVARDETGSVRLVWFNQPYRATAIKSGHDYFISGSFGYSRQRLSITNPNIELVSDLPRNTARIIPIYRETKGVTSRQIRAAAFEIGDAMLALPETLPDWIVKEWQLMPHAQAVYAMHFPRDSQDLARARHRLGFEEVFELVVASQLNKQEIQSEHAPPVPFEEALVKHFVEQLPFQLTDAQRKVTWHIYQDMAQAKPMNRLVEGDVGSGKTLVAAMAALLVLHHGHQVAFMAPTELLARQHVESLKKVLAPVDMDKYVGLLVGGMKPADKRAMHEAVAAGDIRLIVGTHALIQDSVDMHNLELIVIDEQHRFGVEQRKELMRKAGHMPHVLNLTATPIPRSLALTLYGELDISIIDAKPAGRQPIITKICSPNSRAQLNEDIVKELQAGRQMFVVCPLITESDTLKVNSAESIFEQFSTQDFKDFRVGLLHGKMKAEDKNTIMQRFVDHELDILVSTTVIEVGVDVPNASIMLIEGAERFGLAQAHQLRGRVGRGGYQGYCYLMMSDSSQPSKRLRALEQSSDGFKLAELDLELRGPGAIYGQMQHGALDLRIAQLTDSKLLAAAREAALAFVARMHEGEDLVQYKQLAQRVAKLRAVTNLN